MVSASYQNGHVPNFTQQVILAILGFILPPLPIFLLTSPNYTIFTKEFLVSVILTLLGHVPGVLFSLYFIFIEYARAHEGAGGPRDGYIRINENDEESQLRVNNAGDNAHGNHQLGIANVQPPQHQAKTSEPEPPKYEDIAPSNNTATNDSKSHGDNKVQY